MHVRFYNLIFFSYILVLIIKNLIYMNTIESVLAQYEKSKYVSSSISQEERMKRYFTTPLAKGEKQGQKRIRILPTKDGSSPFVEVKFHEIQVGGNWVKLFDPAQEGKRSPLNEICDELLLTGRPEDKELSRSYRSRKFYVVKVIDRDNEQDGVKFWRFKNNIKGDGVLDKIYPIFRTKGDITDPQKGRDLTISISLTKSGKGKEYSMINSILPEDPSPLHENNNTSDDWVNDELIWSDVYAKKSEEFLDLVAKGDTPKWDDASKKYVSSSNEETSTLGSLPENKPLQIEDPQLDDEVDDDLPF